MSTVGALDWLDRLEPEPLREATLARSWPGPHDRLLVEVWPGVARARDLPLGPAERAWSVARLVPPGAILCRQSAVWVHTGAHRPDVLDVVVLGRRKSTAATHVHADRTSLDDAPRLGGVRVTSPGRTAVDVARWGAGQPARLWLEDLRRSGVSDQEVAAALDAVRGRPGVGAARALCARVWSLSAARRSGG